MLTSNNTKNKKLWQLSITILVIVTLTQIVLWYLQIWHPIALVSIVLFGIVWIKYRNNNQLENEKYNNCRFSQLLGNELKNSSYQANKQVFKKCFLKSELYNNAKYNYNGDNLISGESYFISNITVSQVIPKSNNTITIFNGIFAKMKTQNTIVGKVVVKPLPIKDKTVIPEILQHLIHRYFTPKVKSVKTGNNIFDEKFEVFGSSVTKLSEIITKKIIEDILDIDETINYFFGIEYNGMEISFIKNNIYIGVRGVKLSSRESAFDANIAQKYIETIKQIININKQ